MAKTPTQTFFDKASTDPNIAKKSRGWFNKEVVRLRQMRPMPRKIMQQDGRSTRLLPGRLYMFQYEYLTNIHKKAIIGNLVKKYCGKFYTEYNFYAYDEFQPESI